MKLYIERDQAPRMLGGVKFVLNVRADLTAEEERLIEKYKVHREILMKREINIPFWDKVLVLNITIGSLMAGQTFRCNDIGEILEYEKNVKEACEAFKNYIEIMKSFGGREVAEFSSHNQEKIFVKSQNEASEVNEIDPAIAMSDANLLDQDIEREDSELEDKYRDDDSELLRCLSCNAIIPEDHSKCPKCGWSYEP